MNVRKLMPLAGIVFVALVVLSVVCGGSTPGDHASAAELTSFYQAHHAREIGAALLLTVATLFLVAFAVALLVAVWPGGEGERPVWELVLSAGSALAGAATLLAATVHFALAAGAGHVQGGALQALNLVDNNFWVAFNPALGVMMLGAAGAFLARTSGYRRFGWCALVLGIVLFVPFADFFAMLASGLWIIAMSVSLFRGRTDRVPARGARGAGTPLPRESHA